MDLQGIDTLIIDFGGVLIDLDRQRCIDRFDELGITNVQAMLDVCHQQGFFLLHEKGLINDAEFRDEIRKMAGVSVTDTQIDEAWNSFLVGIPSYKLDLLLELRRRYKLYLLSNTNDIHWQWSLRHVFFLDDAEGNCRAAETLGIRTYMPKAHEDWSHLFKS